jgi:ATP-dependent Clp protease ATP-binding subunit ClpC
MHFTPRATVITALAEREADILGHGRVPTTGHGLVAILWEGGGVAARALKDVGLDTEHAELIRHRLSELPPESRGRPLADQGGSAEARKLGHDYIGTEHQLLAISHDESLSTGVLGEDVRLSVRQRVLEILAEMSTRGTAPGA